MGSRTKIGAGPLGVMLLAELVNTEYVPHRLGALTMNADSDLHIVCGYEVLNQDKRLFASKTFAVL